MWLPATVLAALVPVFVGLGVWQLQRAEEKKLLQQEYDQRANETPRRIGGQWQRMEELRFRHVVARGEYDPNY
jgi:surfeit locus 1 family protein